MSSTSSQFTAAQPRSSASKQKLKFACDACGKLKVACPKQQPECERCVSKGRRCTYSLACRNRKPKQNKPQDVTKSIPSPSECWTWPTPSPLELSENEDPVATGDTAMNNNTAIPELPELATHNNSVLPCSLANGLSFTTSSLHEALWRPADHPMASVEPNDPLNTNHQYQEVPMHPYPDNYFPQYVQPVRWPRQPSSPLFTSASSYIGESSEQSTPSLGSASSFSPTTGIEAALLLNNELPQLHPQPQESCFTRTYILLHTLKRPSSNVCIFESADLPSPGLQHTFSESIDKIFLNTDKAIEHVTSVMQCSCHTTSSVRCALTLALFEVISWYETIVRELKQQQGVKTTRDSSPYSSSEEDYDSCSISQRARSESSGSNPSSIVSVPPVSIGGMQLHRADAKSLLGYLVLLRVRKVRGMVQNLDTDSNMSKLGVERLDSVTEEFTKMQRGEVRL